MSIIKQVLKLKGAQNQLNTVLRCFQQRTREQEESMMDERSFPKLLVHFLGDCQEFSDNDFYNGRYGSLRNYCIENVGENFAKRFPGTEILIVKPTIFFHSRSIYTNFVKMNADIGSIPHYTISLDCLQHIEELIADFYRQIGQELPVESSPYSSLKIALSGFSSGGIVLNQMIFSLKAAKEASYKSKIQITDWYFLDIGSCLVHGNYIYSKNIVEAIELHESGDVNVNIGLTDFQTSFKENPGYLKEAQLFEQTLSTVLNGINVRTIHLKDESGMNCCDYNLALHFSIYNELFVGRL